MVQAERPLHINYHIVTVCKELLIHRAVDGLKGKSYTYKLDNC